MDPKNISWGADLTKSSGHRFCWQGRWVQHHLPPPLLTCSISKSSTNSLLSSLQRGNWKGPKQLWHPTRKESLQSVRACAQLSPQPPQESIWHFQKKSRMGMFPGPSLLHLSEITAETRGEGVGGREPWKDWCKFIFKSQKDENNFHSPTAVLRIFSDQACSADNSCGRSGLWNHSALAGSVLWERWASLVSHSMLPFAHLSPLSTCSPGVLERMGSPSPASSAPCQHLSAQKTRRGRKPKTGNRHKPWHCTAGRRCQASDHRTDRRTHSCTYPGYFPINQPCQQPAKSFLQLPLHFVEQDLTLVFKGYKNLSVLEPDNTCSGTYCCAPRPGAW